jgi:hypothetical protein
MGKKEAIRTRYIHVLWVVLLILLVLLIMTFLKCEMAHPAY